jgi:hypothetical protein
VHGELLAVDKTHTECGGKHMGMAIIAQGKIVNGQLRCKRPIKLAEGTTVQATLRPLVGDIKDLGMTSGSGLIVDPLEAVLGTCEGGRPDGVARHDHYIYRKRFGNHRKKQSERASWARRGLGGGS